ncbi:MAG: DNA polymerase III subunit alpha [Phycisphaerae bacterium]
MSDAAFVHLHVHTHYSLLDGATRIKPLVEMAKAMGMPAVAITDHGNMFGAVEFYRAAVKAGVKPIIGCEAYMAPGDRRVKQSKMKEASNHLLLLAMNNVGYKNLLKLSSIGYLEGFYYRPRIDKETLRQYSEGLLCTSTCLGAEIPQALLNKDRRAAEAVAKTYLEIFGPDRFFIELQDHGMDEQRMINPELLDMAEKLGVAVIATNDVHYLEHDDQEAHDVLCCISTRSLVTDSDRFKFSTDQFYFKSPTEMRQLFADCPESLDNTLRIADLCNVDLDFSTRHSPVYKLPEGRKGDEYLRELVYEGARRRYDEITDEVRERVDYELGVISDKGFSGYFLIVWDFMRYARSKGIPCGARGSGCSSVVSYCLEISDPDPLRYGLYFERFMDPDRDELPDIDVDICQVHRPDVIEYVRQKYGHVAQIITFGTLKAKAAVKDVARVMGMGFNEANELTNLIPSELNITIDRALEAEPELKKRYDADAGVKKILDLARKLEGLSRHAGVHAAGIVVADTPLNEYLALYKSANDDQIITQFDGTTVELVGLLKFDFLGLRTLTTLERARQLAQQSTGASIDLDHLDLTDERVYELFARGDTKGVFQFESGGMRDVIMRMKPNRIEDLIAANALFRPGPMQYIDAYVARKHGEKWSTAHPIMSEVLAETYGIMVYQEQVSRVVNRLGGIELKRAFRLAKAISKKKTRMIESEREPFLQGCEQNGVKRKVAEQVFEDILKFGGYAFNKAHSTGYALVAFKTAYMKVYYPVEFMAASMTFEMSNTDKILDYFEECKRLGITVLPPDINRSGNDFTVDHVEREGQPASEIRFGLAAVKGVGEKAVSAICRARDEGGAFEDIYDFCERVDPSACNRSGIEALINCGAFDRTGAMRKALFKVLNGAMEQGWRLQQDRRTGQMGLFGGVDDDEAAHPPLPDDEWTEAEMLAKEKAALGFYVTRHPLANSGELIKACASAATVDLSAMVPDTRVVIGGMVSSLRTVMTRKNEKMGIVTLEDLKGSIEGILFPKSLEKFRPLLTPDSIVFLAGQVDKRREEASLRITDVIPASDAPRRLCKQVILGIGSATAPDGVLEQFKAIFARHSGNKEVVFRITTDDQMEAMLRCPMQFAIDPSDRFRSEAAALLGRDAIMFVGPGNRPIPLPPLNGDPAPAASEIKEPGKKVPAGV